MQTQVRSAAGRQTVKRLLGQAGAIMSVAALVACSGSSSQGATETSAASSAATPASATSASAVALPAVGVELPASQIPWNQVGQGWMLSTWSSAPGLRPGEDPPAGQPRVAPSTLYLLDPAGGRYPLATFPVAGADAATGDPGETLRLTDWSGDGKHALFSDVGTKVDGKFETTVTDLDLATGAKQTFTVAGARYVNPWVSVSYTRPTGKAVLVSTTEQGNSGPSSTMVKRVDLSGAEQLTFRTELGAAGRSSGSYLEFPDGSQLVFGATNGMVIVGNDGVVGKQLPAMPTDVHSCSPVRWWTPTEVLARCDIGEFPHGASQLWLVPVDSGAPTALTAPNTGEPDSGFGSDLGDGAAWQLPSGIYLQSAGACGTEFLSRLTPDKHTTKVTIPGVDSSSVGVVGATADKLVLMGHAGCGPGTSLLTFDPAANATAVLLGPPVNGGGVQNARLYPAL